MMVGNADPDLSRRIVRAAYASNHCRTGSKVGGAVTCGRNGDARRAAKLQMPKGPSAILAVALLAGSGAHAAEEDPGGAASQSNAQSPSLESMGPTLSFAEKPPRFNIESFGPMTLSVAGSGLYQWQTNPLSGDHTGLGDFSNAHVILQKSTGELQFLVHAGVYSFPTLGIAYLRSGKAVPNFYGPVPETYVKYAPNDQFSIMAGQIPSLGGVENAFSYQNINIQRGLLWGETSSISRGVQATEVFGPLAFSFAWTDGFYSNHYSWASGSLVWTVDPENSLTFIGAANTKPTSVAKVAAPITENNSEIFNLIYTHASGPWTITPYLQLTRIPALPQFGLSTSAETLGGAVLIAYKFPMAAEIGAFSLNGVSLPLRAEYLSARAAAIDGAPNVLFGPNSRAWTLTITPTLQRGPFFFRAEYAFVRATRFDFGFGFGNQGDRSSQSRVAIECGVVF
jgi:Putative beta-barrel porin-2, OmpL-like. bbp2